MAELSEARTSPAFERRRRPAAQRAPRTSFISSRLSPPTANCPLTSLTPLTQSAPFSSLSPFTHLLPLNVHISLLTPKLTPLSTYQTPPLCPLPLPLHHLTPHPSHPLYLHYSPFVSLHPSPLYLPYPQFLASLPSPPYPLTLHSFTPLAANSRIPYITPSPPHFFPPPDHPLNHRPVHVFY